MPGPTLAVKAHQANRHLSVISGMSLACVQTAIRCPLYTALPTRKRDRQLATRKR